MDFPALTTIQDWAASDQEREFARLEFTQDLGYYLTRIDRLMLSGDDVLDAGCGMGQWSIALSQRFRRVASFDLMPSRLEVLRRMAEHLHIANLAVQQGTLEELPYADSSFDAVFCYGVIMFTRVPRVLAEFHRVLRPGGRVYVCLNGDGWSRYLIEERGRGEPAVRYAGQDTLYKTAWHRAAGEGLLDHLGRIRSHRPHWKNRLISRLARLGIVRGFVAGRILESAPAGQQLRQAVRAQCGRGFLRRLAEDVIAGWRGDAVLDRLGAARAYLPREFATLAREAGFVDFQWAPENGLVCDWRIAAPSSKYEPEFAGQVNVWECLFSKPESQGCAVRLETHLEAGRQAGRQPVVTAHAPTMVLSSGSTESYPQALLKAATAQAQTHGGPRYLRRLAEALVQGIQDEDDRVRAILRFVQAALFRDPCAQPLLEDSQLPDAGTILFCARGRCGHAAKLTAALAEAAGLRGRVRQLPKHLIAEIHANGRWVIADADAFKHGVIPVDRQGRLLTMEALEQDPYQLDRFPATGFFFRPDTRYTRSVNGARVTGYVDALEPEDRGYVSGHFVERAAGKPPSLPHDVRIETRGARFIVQWAPSRSTVDALLGYRVAVSTRSRGWTYDDFAASDHVIQPLPADVLSTETRELRVEGVTPQHAKALYASVTAYTSRIDKAADTYFQPSDEACHEL